MNTVTHIGNGAFEDCASLRSIAIPDSVMQTGRYTFEHCSELTLTAPARLLHPGIGEGIKMVAKECGCGECDYRRFQYGWVCPKHVGSSLQGCGMSA